MSLNDFSTKLRYFRAKIRPLLKPIVWGPAGVILLGAFFLTEYLANPGAFSLWDAAQTEVPLEVVSESGEAAASTQKPKEQSKQASQSSESQKLLDQLMLKNSQGSIGADNGKNPLQNQSGKLPSGESAPLVDSMLLPMQNRPSLGMDLLNGNKQGVSTMPVNPLQAALDKYPTPPVSGSAGVGLPSVGGASNGGSVTSSLDSTGSVPSSANPSGASFLEAATGMATMPVSPPVSNPSGVQTSATGVTTPTSPNSYSYLTGSPASTPTAAPVVPVVTPALQNSGSLLPIQAEPTVTQPQVSVPPQSTVPTQVAPVVPVGPVNYGPSAVSGGGGPVVPGVGNYGQASYPSPGAGVVQPVMPGASSYGSATYPNVTPGVANGGYPTYVNPGVQPVVPGQVNAVPGAIGDGNINTFSNPTGNQ